LTSGQKNTAIEGIDLLKNLVEKSQNRIEIMVGSGVSAQNAQQLLTIGVHALHMTGKGIQESKMIFRKPDVSMASVALTNEYEIYEADFDKCKAVVEILKK
jgi:copper homeostasis protein